jgi:hypothetical protein
VGRPGPHRVLWIRRVTLHGWRHTSNIRRHWKDLGLLIPLAPQTEPESTNSNDQEDHAADRAADDGSYVSLLARVWGRRRRMESSGLCRENPCWSTRGDRSLFTEVYRHSIVVPSKDWCFPSCPTFSSAASLDRRHNASHWEVTYVPPVICKMAGGTKYSVKFGR